MIQYPGACYLFLTGAPNGKFWEEALKQQQSMNKDFWSHSVFIILEARLMEESPASKVHLQPAFWLTGQNSAFQWSVCVGGGGGKSSNIMGGGRRRGEGFWQIAQNRYSGHLIPSDILNCLFPSKTLLRRTYYFFQISQPANIWHTCRKDGYLRLQRKHKSHRMSKLCSAE